MLREKTEGWWTFEEVQARLVEAAELWRRSPGGGRWPFATDGPWHLLTRKVRAGSDMEAWRAESEAGGGRRPLPLSRAEIDLRDQVSEWLRIVDEGDRRIVTLALIDLAAGRRVRWTAMRGKLGVELTADGLWRRYRRSIAAIAAHLNARRVKIAA